MVTPNFAGRRRRGSGFGRIQAEAEVEENPPHEDETTIDDPTLPTMTLRMWVMGISACVAQAFLSSRSMFQEDTLDLPFILVVNLTFCMGQSMAVLLPNKSVKVPWTRGFQFSLNPGPFNWKEHTLVSLCAYLGRMHPFFLQKVSIIALYFHKDIHFTAVLSHVNPVSTICRLLSGLLYPNINFTCRIVINAVSFIGFFKLVNYLKFPLRVALAVVVVASITSVLVSYWVVWYHINTGKINLAVALAIGL